MKSKQKLPDFTYINDAESLRWLAVDLSQEALIALDTESNSLYAYRERVCLVQLSTRHADYIIDPFAVEDLSPLGVILSDPNIKKVLHAAEYDLVTLKRDYGFTVSNLFDTMLAARLLGIGEFGLAALIERYFGVQLDKSHQRDNWGVRPLPSDSLRYAQMDTHYLPTLHDMLYDELQAKGLYPEALEIFGEAETVPLLDSNHDPEGYWKIGRPQRLNLREMTILKELYLWREGVAQREDIPTFKVLSNRALVNIAQDAPTTLRQLTHLPEVSATHTRRYGYELLAAVERGLSAKPPVPPPLPESPDAELAERFFMLQQWRKEKGEQRGIGSDMVLAKGTLWLLARDLPDSLEALAQVEGIGKQRLALYGEDLLRLLASLRTDSTPKNL